MSGPHTIAFTPAQDAEYLDRLSRNRDCPRCGRVAWAVVLERLAAAPEVVTLCHDCGTNRAKAL